MFNNKVAHPLVLCLYSFHRWHQSNPPAHPIYQRFHIHTGQRANMRKVFCLAGSGICAPWLFHRKGRPVVANTTDVFANKSPLMYASDFAGLGL